MGRGGKLLLRKSKKRRVCSEDKGSDDSDEDYVLGEDEENETSDDSDGAFSLGEASEETFDFGDDDDEEEERKVVRSKPKKGFSGRRKITVKRSCNRTIVSDEEEDYELDDEEFIPDGIDCVDKSERRAFRSNSQEGSSDRIKRTRERTMVSADYDDGDDDDDDEVNSDDDDEEFMPDGIDCADDEEELLVSKKHKVRNRLMPKRVTAKGRKRKWQSKVSKKPLRKKRRRLRSALMRPKSSDDGFIVVNKVVREKSEKKPGRRKKRSIVFSDSDFIRSGSSDFEYTISEEEREMVRETSIFGGNSTPCLRSSSQLKRLHVNGALQKKAPERKEKEKVEDLQLDLGKQVCGICFSDEGKGVVQGTLDCCSHYFCFACIMEWSKVESRCPLCKQRFATISKPARSNVGIDLRNMVIRIPKRDQVYQPSEEEVRGYLDPYENVVCMECHQGGDDYLMLLCDICDSPAHTYCVSLGREVPEGNWYCEGCRPSDPASSNSTIRPVSDQVTVNSNLPTELSTGDINAEGSDSTFQHSVSVSSPSFSPGIGVLPSPRFAQVENFNATSPLSGVGASTLSGRRRIRYRIHSLLSSYRMNQGAEMASRTDGTSQVNLGSYFVNTELKLGGETTHQNPITSESGRPCFAVEGMAQKSPLCPMQDEDTFAARLSHLRRHVNEGPSTATLSGSAHGILYGDSAEVSEVSGLEQLHQGGSMPTSGIDSSISHNTYTDDPIFMWKKVQRNNCNQW